MTRTSVLALSAILFATACGGAGGAKLATYEAREQQAAHQLELFDDLDFHVFSGQKWDEFPKSHAKDIKVYWPDGHFTTGLDKHLEDLKVMFVYAPDTRIEEHPIKIGNGEWTAVYGIMIGTFTKPMPLPDGTSIPPTGKAFRLPMATIGHWGTEGVMTEEYLFWDNATYMKQLGLAK
jgi:SnoaL-like polyketide cyclase